MEVCWFYQYSHGSCETTNWLFIKLPTIWTMIISTNYVGDGRYPSLSKWDEFTVLDTFEDKNFPTKFILRLNIVSIKKWETNIDCLEKLWTYIIAEALFPSIFTLVFFQLQADLEIQWWDSYFSSDSENWLWYFTNLLQL